MKKYIFRSLTLMVMMCAVLSWGGRQMAIDFPAVFEVIASGQAAKMPRNLKTTVVLDAGHGGWDAGKVGVAGSLEKELNLQIAEKVKACLEQMDISVVMTRTDDGGLYSEGSKNKKREDMNKRVQIINESGAQFAVSIHQNSFTQPQYQGAQVFYYSHSPEGQRLAAAIQNSLVQRVQPDNTRLEKANDEYFILKYSDIPVVITECGFLSNAQEEAKLCDEDYQQKIAWAIAMGVVNYKNQEK